jgi:hypothetical protein
MIWYNRYKHAMQPAQPLSKASLHADVKSSPLLNLAAELVNEADILPAEED